MATTISAPLPELDWPKQTVITVNANDPGAVVESLIILVSEDAPTEAFEADAVVPPFVYATPT